MYDKNYVCHFFCMPYKILGYIYIGGTDIEKFFHSRVSLTIFGIIFCNRCSFQDLFNLSFYFIFNPNIKKLHK